MRGTFLIGLVALALAGCGDSRYDYEFDLDEKTFDADAMKMVRDEAGITLPPETRGLNFHYLPPIDPSFVARLEIPKEARNQVLDQIAAQKIDNTTSSGGLPDKVAWWKPSQGQIIIDRQWLRGDCEYTRAVLVSEGDKLILYIYHSV